MGQPNQFIPIRVIGAILLGLMTTPVHAENSLSELYHQVRGGKLYDNWFVALKVRPAKGNHPAYPASGRKSGWDTWRCKECHGWDYKGAAGRYAQGEHFTGIGGIRQWEGKEPGQVVAILRDQTHGFTAELIPDGAAADLALFITKGQVDMDLVIDQATRKVKGDPQQGLPYYQTICAVCHGLDGKRMNFGSEGDPEYLGTAAQDNPWEILHKIRNGQPGQEMISLSALPLQVQLDILSYVQTLPVK